MNVVIVAKTKLGAGVCVGAIDSTLNSLRLYESNGTFPPANTPYGIGQLWDMDLEAKPNQRLPHLEDVVVTRRAQLASIPNLRSYLLERIEPWTGGVADLFEGKLGFTHQGRGYIEAPNLPSRSTWFWTPDRELRANAASASRTYYRYNNSHDLTYVGVATPIDVIPTGTLVRVSLARWWKPPNADDSFPERCYLQLSGWYL